MNCFNISIPILKQKHESIPVSVQPKGQNSQRFESCGTTGVKKSQTQTYLQGFPSGCTEVENVSEFPENLQWEAKLRTLGKKKIKLGNGSIGVNWKFD